MKQPSFKIGLSALLINWYLYILLSLLTVIDNHTLSTCQHEKTHSQTWSVLNHRLIVASTKKWNGTVSTLLLFIILPYSIVYYLLSDVKCSLKGTFSLAHNFSVIWAHFWVNGNFKLCLEIITCSIFELLSRILVTLSVDWLDSAFVFYPQSSSLHS